MSRYEKLERVAFCIAMALAAVALLADLFLWRP